MIRYTRLPIRIWFKNDSRKYTTSEGENDFDVFVKKIDTRRRIYSYNRTLCFKPDHRSARYDSATIHKNIFLKTRPFHRTPSLENGQTRCLTFSSTRTSDSNNSCFGRKPNVDGALRFLFHVSSRPRATHSS